MRAVPPISVTVPGADDSWKSNPKKPRGKRGKRALQQAGHYQAQAARGGRNARQMPTRQLQRGR